MTFKELRDKLNVQHITLDTPKGIVDEFDTNDDSYDECVVGQIEPYINYKGFARMFVRVY